jgi:ComF family protein
MHEWLRKVIDEAADVVLPPRCPVCNEPAPEGRALFCVGCAEIVEIAPHPVIAAAGEPLTDLVAAFAYGGPVADAIVRFKHGDVPALGTRIARLALEVARAQDADVIVPVPLHPARIASRGFNQASVVASEVSRALGRPVSTGWLRRIRDTPSMSGMGRVERHANVKRAFEARHLTGKLSGATALLVDDVWTTGATATACARALLAAGIGQVRAYTLARVM